MMVHFGIEHIEFLDDRDGRVVCERVGTCLSSCGLKRVRSPFRELPIAEAIALFDYTNREATKWFIIKTVVGTVYVLLMILLAAIKIAETG